MSSHCIQNQKHMNFDLLVAAKAGILMVLAMMSLHCFESCACVSTLEMNCNEQRTCRRCLKSVSTGRSYLVFRFEQRQIRKVVAQRDK